MANRNMLPGRTAAPRAMTVWLLALLAAACVRHLPVVGETEGQASSSKAGASGRAGSAGASARRTASDQSAQRAASAGSKSDQGNQDDQGDQDEEASGEPAAPSAGKSGSKPAASGTARAEAGSAAPADKASKAGSGAAEPDTSKAGSGAAPSSTPSTPSTPSGTAGSGWYCAQANDVCSCVEGSGVSGDNCTSHPTCCFEATNGTTYRSCFCVADGSPECMAYNMTTAQQVKKISSCPF
jgi:hypothetical protein